jgi:CubicO group peptidase (beta-lactamase class C family)
MKVDVSAVQPRVQKVVEQLVGSGRETGLQAAAYWRGELVVDAAAGVADPATGAPVDGQTLFHSFSTGKGVTATVAHVLAKQGLIDYDAPVARYWPQFAAHGKQQVTVRQVLTHTAGVPQLPQDITPADMCDWDGMYTRIADLPLLWQPGTRTGYHGWTFGWIIGELARRVTGQPISQVLHDLVAAPLGVADSLFFGIPDEVAPRLATLVEGNWAASLAAAPDNAPMFIAAPRSVLAVADLSNRPDYLRADIPAAATMTARAVARMYAALIGDVDSVRLLSADHLAHVIALATADTDQILGNPIRKGLGYFLGLSWAGAATTSFGTTGSGGSAAFADPAHDLAIAITKNRLTVGRDDTAAMTIAHEIYDALGITRPA